MDPLRAAGRAGRRGIDEVGYGVTLWSPFKPFDQVASLARHGFDVLGVERDGARAPGTYVVRARRSTP